MLQRTNSDHKDFTALTAILDAELCRIYGTKQEDYEEYNRITDLHTVVVAYEDQDAVGCGCFKIYSDDTVEIKRMFVKEGLRGKGIASRILAELETWAGELGYASAILETGKGQPEAIRLYQKLGYSPIENYGQYDGKALSVCMTKRLN